MPKHRIDFQADVASVKLFHRALKLTDARSALKRLQQTYTALKRAAHFSKKVIKSFSRPHSKKSSRSAGSRSKRKTIVIPDKSDSSSSSSDSKSSSSSSSDSESSSSSSDSSDNDCDNCELDGFKKNKDDSESDDSDGSDDEKDKKDNLYDDESNSKKKKKKDQMECYDGVCKISTMDGKTTAASGRTNSFNIPPLMNDNKHNAFVIKKQDPVKDGRINIGGVVDLTPALESVIKIMSPLFTDLANKALPSQDVTTVSAAAQVSVPTTENNKQVHDQPTK
ncbi:MAG: hypothetical protein Solumvirus1_10 [Solumvirus sp.]|uniref:Uncharacterized protein n=1 Tax=Solumvirus sp. TaxID=2487773 RepID=A0A3G5AG00_9VIRU|nr:MAG: hypothetical protein Solumvirus1_10 [Solumvirus sp.]